MVLTDGETSTSFHSAEFLDRNSFVWITQTFPERLSVKYLLFVEDQNSRNELLSKMSQQ